MVRFRTSIVSLAALVALAACSDAPSATEPTIDATASAARKPKGTPTSPSAPTSPTEPTSPSTGTTVTGCDGSAVALTSDEKAQLDLHNGKRAQLGHAAYCVSPQLTAAARAHSADMQARNYMSHTSADGTAFNVRIANFGYPGWYVAENIAWGSSYLGTASSVFNWWLNSAPHYANIANGGLREIGIGVAYGYYQGYSGAAVWTVDFGTR